MADMGWNGIFELPSLKLFGCPPVKRAVVIFAERAGKPSGGGWGWHGGSGIFDFGEVSDVGEALEIVVLGPEGGVVGEGDGVDEGIGEREFVFDKEIGGGNGDFLVDVDQDAGKHGAGDFLGFFGRALLEGDFADFGDDDCGNDQLRQFEEDGAEVNSVRAVFEAFEPRGGVEDVGLHDPGSLELAIRFPFELQRLVAFEVSDELLRGKNGADFDFAVLFRELEALAGFEVHGFPDLFWDNDLVFG
jgi:hypothetical protein